MAKDLNDGIRCLSLIKPGEEAIKEGCGEVSFTGVREDDDYGLTLVAGFPCDSRGNDHCCTARNTGKDTFLLGQSSRHLNGLIIADRFYPVDKGEIQDFRYKTGSDPLDLVRTRLNLFSVSCLG